MSVYNGERFLNNAIDSILNQTFSDFEFIIIDDASTDRTAEILKTYSDPRIRIMKNNQNQGLTKSMNKELTLARGIYIARMDADDISLPNRLATQLRFLDNNPEFALIGSSAYLIDENNITIGTQREICNITFSDLLSQNHFIHGSIMMRKSVLDNVGGYNERLPYAQDYDLWLRISKKHKVGNMLQRLYRLRRHKAAIKYQKAEESALYHIFAQKIARNETSNPVYTIIQNNINDIYKYLSKNDLFFLYGARSEFYLQRNDLKNARLQYKKRFFLKYKLLDLIDYFLTFLGLKFMNDTKKVRRLILNGLCEIDDYLE
jgi:glycosyltransferase involved in cell wall biosynthesis